jgi:hypothetical protein
MTEMTDYNNSARDLGWLPEPWWCGAPDTRCTYCGRPVIFAPACLGLDACTCGATPEQTASTRTEATTKTRTNLKTMSETEDRIPTAPRRTVPPSRLHGPQQLPVRFAPAIRFRITIFCNSREMVRTAQKNREGTPACQRTAARQPCAAAEQEVGAA